MPYKDVEARRAAQRRWYQNNKEVFADKNIRVREAKRQFLKEFKNNPCTDCGVRYPHYVMDLHHLNGSDKFSIQGI